MHFTKSWNVSRRKVNKIWIDKGGQFYNRSMKLQLQDNDIVMYSRHNKGKTIVAKRFTRTLQNTICIRKSLIHNFNFKKSIYW